MMTDGRLFVIFQNSFRRVTLSMRAAVVISGNLAVPLGRRVGILLWARVISTVTPEPRSNRSEVPSR